MNPLVHFDKDGVKYDEIETWELRYGSKEYKQAEKNNKANRKKVCLQVVKAILLQE